MPSATCLTNSMPYPPQNNVIISTMVVPRRGIRGRYVGGILLVRKYNEFLSSKDDGLASRTSPVQIRPLLNDAMPQNFHNELATLRRLHIHRKLTCRNVVFSRKLRLA